MPAIFDSGMHIPITGRRPSASATGVWMFEAARVRSGSRRRCGTSREQNGLCGKSGAVMHSESSRAAQPLRRIRRAGHAERQPGGDRIDADQLEPVARRQLGADLADADAAQRIRARLRELVRRQPDLRLAAEVDRALAAARRVRRADGVRALGSFRSGPMPASMLPDASRHVTATPGQRDREACDGEATPHRERSSSSRPLCHGHAHYNLSLHGRSMTMPPPPTRPPPSCSSGTRSCRARSRTRTPAF